MSNRNNHRLSNAIKLALGSGLAVAMTFGPLVHAAGEDGAAELERVQVTGSRISALDIEGSAPVTVITRDDINRVPFDSLGQLIQSTPSFNGGAVNTFTNNSGDGSVTANLRGLGSSRTLILINGRRADANADLNSIPLAIIERVEILKDGASAVYGADAVAGVINVITRTNYEGMEVSVQTQNWTQTTAPTTKVSGITGGSSDRGNFVLGFDYVDQDGAYQGELDTPWMQRAIFLFDPVGFIRNGVIEEGPDANAFAGGSSSIPGGRFFLTSGGDMTLHYTRNPDGTRTYEVGDDVSHFRAFDGAGAENDFYNYNPVNYIQTPSERISLFGQGRYDINSDLSAFIESAFQRRKSSQILAPLPYFSDLGDPGYSYTVMVDTNGDGVPDTPDTRSGVSADNYYNVFGENLEVRRRMVETGGRKFFQTADTFRTTFGVEGTVFNNWNYEVSYNYSATTQVDTDYGQFAGSRLELALGPSFMDENGNIVCGSDPDGTPGNGDETVIAGCVPLNLFGGPGSITTDMLNYVSVALNDRFDSHTQVLSGFISGDLIELPAGPLQAAFGIENRYEYASFVPDSSKVLDQVTGNTSEPVAGGKRVESAYAEFGIPLLYDAPLVKSLEMTLGARRDSFDTFGSATSHQLALRWQPIDSILVRTTVGSSFREPTIGNLYAGQSDSFPVAGDPCGSSSWSTLTSEQQARCSAQGVPTGGWNDSGISQLRARVGGNPEVGPEEGESFTFGIGYAPDYIPGFSIVLDYWDFEVENTIDAVGIQTILNGCIIDGTASFCDNIVRSPTGSLDYVVSLVDNLGTLTAKGYDLEINYAHGSGFGDFSHRLNLTYLKERTQQEYPGAPVRELDGEFDATFNFDEGFPKWKYTYVADWSYGDWGASARVDYVGKMIDRNEQPPYFLWDYDEYQFVIRPVAYLDLTGRYFLDGDDSVVEFGMTNVTNEEPPYIPAAFNSNIDETNHRPMGSGYFVRFTQRF